MAQPLPEELRSQPQFQNPNYRHVQCLFDFDILTSAPQAIGGDPGCFDDLDVWPVWSVLRDDFCLTIYGHTEDAHAVLFMIKEKEETEDWAMGYADKFFAEGVYSFVMTAHDDSVSVTAYDQRRAIL